jgi:hypothetical protein
VNTAGSSSNKGVNFSISATIQSGVTSVSQ